MTNTNSITKGEATCYFGVVQVTDTGSGSLHNTKHFDGDKARVFVDKTQILIGNGYQVRWKKVVSLTVNDNDNGTGTGGGFLLESDKFVFQASNNNNNEDNINNNDWRICRRLLEKYWNKKQNKELKKQRKEEQADEEEEKASNRRAYKSQSYSKRSRASLFLARNAANFKEWESDDDEVFNRLPPKKARLQEQEKEQQDQEDEHQEPLEDDDGDEGEATFGDDDDVNNDGDGDDDDDDDVNNNEKHNTMEDNAVDGEDASLPEETSFESKSKFKSKRRIQSKRKVINDEDADSDDDDLFSDPVHTTTPMAVQRIVSPGTALRDDDDDDNHYHEVVEEVDEQSLLEEEKGLQNISNFFTSSSVTPTLAVSTTTGTKPKSSHNKKSTSSSDTATTTTTTTLPRLSKEQEQDAPAEEPTSPSPLLLPKVKTSSNSFFAPRRLDPTKSPKKKQDAPSPPSDDSTVLACPSPSPTPTDMMEEEGSVENENENEKAVISTPKSSKTKPFFFTDDSATTLEEEDPIVGDSPSTTTTAAAAASQNRLQQRRPLSGKKRLFKTYSKRNETPSTSSTTTSMALELADARSPALGSPLANLLQSSPGKMTPTKSPPPLAPLPLPLFRGLRNLGNTCYMNASLQMLYSVPSFVKALSTSPTGRKLVSGIDKLWQDLQARSKRSAATARSVKLVMDDLTDKFRGYQQRDAHEFLGELLDQIHEELETTTTNTTTTPPKEDQEEKKQEDSDKDHSLDKPRDVLPTDAFFRLNVEVCLECKSCGYSRTKEEMYRYLSIDIADETGEKPTVEKCLDHFFKPEEREINCEKCEEGKIATQTMRVLSRPKALLLHLKRFVVVEKPIAENGADNEESPKSPRMEMVFCKNKAPVELNQNLSLSKFLAKDEGSSRESYELQSIVHHIGSSADSGHYTADAQRMNPESKRPTWVSFDDGLISETTSSTVRNSLQNQRTAYVLLYSSTV